MGSKLQGDTEVRAGAAQAGTTRVPRVSAVSGPGAGRSFAMARTDATAGRHATNDLVLDDPRVSGVHLELHRAADRVRVRDAGSTNGTWLGSYRVTEIELCDGAELLVGDTLLRVELDEDAPPAATSRAESFGGVVGRSIVMRELFAVLERVAPKDLSVLFHGEAGTGKEELARAVVAHSARSSGPFLVVDATAIPDALLFGRVGSGDDGRVAGVLESANHGTVFIDEIGALAPDAQARLLRLLERKDLVRVDSHTAIPIDVRVLAATTRDLRREIEAGRFREELYFCLAEPRIFVPPLRDRVEDIPLLCHSILDAVGRTPPLSVDEEALERLATYHWPGNVRELRSVLRRACAVVDGNVLRLADVDGEGSASRATSEGREALELDGTFRAAKERAIERFESAYLSTLMRRFNGNVTRAAREADLARHQLRDLLKKRELYGVAWEALEE
jgi:DNA-binding NtrC family response regulator